MYLILWRETSIEHVPWMMFCFAVPYQAETNKVLMMCLDGLCGNKSHRYVDTSRSLGLY